MLLYLQIVFTIISALFIAAVLPVGAFLGWTYAIICALGAVFFYVAMLLCKQARGVNNSAVNDEKSENSTSEKDE
jgi:hypothetical protein